MGMVDVRDCAMGHLLALEKGGTGERYCLTNHWHWFKDTGELLKAEFGGRGYPKVVTKEFKKCMMSFAAIFMKEAKLVKPWLGVEYDISGKKAEEQLGLVYRDERESLVDMVHSMIEMEILPNQLTD